MEDTVHIRVRVPETLLDKLKARSEENLRSVNAEVIHIFRHYLKVTGPVKKKAKARA